MATAKRGKNKGGRPSDYTQELADKICSELSIGKSLRTVCGEEDMPSTTTIFSWFRKYPEFLSQYARAKEESADAMAEEVLDISDEGQNDWMEKNFGKSTAWVVNGEAVQRSKLRVETRKWIMSKMKPKKYGDKVDFTSDGKPVNVTVVQYNKLDDGNNIAPPLPTASLPASSA